MPKKDAGPDYQEIIASILQAAVGPLPIRDVADELLAVHPSQAKNPLSAARTHIRQANGWQLVFLDKETILPLRLAFQNVRFRLPLDREIVNTGLLDIGNTLPSYLPLRFPLEQVRFVDTDFQPIPAQYKEVTQKRKSLLGEYDYTTQYVHLGNWFRTQKMYAKDHLLFTIVNWQEGILQLEREAYGQIDQSLLAKRNQLLADTFYTLLEDQRDEDMRAYEAVPTVYALLPDKSGYPPYHWMLVLQEDERMTYDSWRIHYSDSGFSPMERLAQKFGGETRETPAPIFTKAQRKQVYRFRASLKYRPNIWREIEVQGEQTLANLDWELRSSFHHDMGDHMGGFWKLVARGAAKQKRPRYREVDLGSVNPLGEGDAADIEIAGLELEVGDALKYVYDFGDWIEHRLTLESITAPEEGIKYPRETARNQPEHIYCGDCQRKGKQQVAKWFCETCSESPQELVAVCGKCARKHDDHYLDEIVY
jgi:hypothetical protein